jgi:hypothetical protein
MRFILATADLSNSDFNVYGTQMHAFARSYTEVVGSNPTRGMDVCVAYVFVFCCMGNDLVMGSSSV